MIHSQTRIRVRYAETDQMRRAYHANYLIWFEAARIDLLRSIELPYDKLEEEGFYLPVVEIKVKYLQPAYFDEEIIVNSFIKSEPHGRFIIEYIVNRLSGEEIALGESLHIFMSENGKALRPPDSFRQKMKSFF